MFNRGNKPHNASFQFPSFNGPTNKSSGTILPIDIPTLEQHTIKKRKTPITNETDDDNSSKKSKKGRSTKKKTNDMPADTSMSSSISKLFIPKRRKRILNSSSQMTQRSYNGDQSNSSQSTGQSLIQALVDEMEDYETESNSSTLRKIRSDFIKWGPQCSPEPSDPFSIRCLTEKVLNREKTMAVSTNGTEETNIEQNSEVSASSFLPCESYAQPNEKTPNTKEFMPVAPNSTEEMDTNCNNSTAIIPTGVTRIRSFVKSAQQGEPNKDDGNNKQSTEENLTREETANAKDTMVIATAPMTKATPKEADKTFHSETASVLTPSVTRRVTRQSIRLAQQQKSSSNDNENSAHSVEKAKAQTPMKKTSKKKTTKATKKSKATDKTSETNNSVTVVPTSTNSYKENSSNSVATHDKVSTPDHHGMGTNIDKNTTAQHQIDDTSNVVADDECKQCRKTKHYYEFKKAQIDMEMTNNKHQYELKRASMRTDFVCSLLDKGQNQEQITFWLRECFD
ncbi:hypothetical protein INT45_007446 [Circinella minor]|uniref:Uncharacterized protein n=1 Tax=Circinella minor TaxID=1195481 RepID=A0A8H7VLT5_9FUNG|nr:hypothetical protein INT45_007446 [Circinella minor]